MTRTERYPKEILEDDTMSKAEKIELLEKMAYEVAEREVAELEGMNHEDPDDALNNQMSPREALNRLRDENTATNTQHGSL